MKDDRLLFGPLAAAVFACGVLGMAFLVPGYDPIRQTVSEIGEADSPVRVPFAIMLWVVALCLWVFAWRVRAASIARGCGAWAAYLIAFVGVDAAGIGVFAFPHPLHNVFGESELIGYQAPLAFALSWRRDDKAGAIVAFSWVMFALIWAAVLLNLTTLFRHGPVWTAIKPVYGVAQRLLFATFFAWVAGLGGMLWNLGRRAA